MAEFQAAVETVGDHNPDAAREACERMDRQREIIRQRQGVLDIGVPAIRELRGGLPE